MKKIFWPVIQPGVPLRSSDRNDAGSAFCTAKVLQTIFGLLVTIFLWPGVLQAQLATGTVDFTVDDLHDKTQVTITLSDASTLVLLKDYVVDDGPGKFTWMGFVQDDANGRAYITVDAPNAVGSIHTSAKFYKLVLSEETSEPVQEVDTSTFPPLAEPLKLAIFDSGFEALPPELLAESPTAACDDTPESIDVMVLYSDDAAAANPQIELEIAQAIEATRNIFKYSNFKPGVVGGIELDVNLVHTQMVQVNENPALGSVKLLESFTNNTLVTNAHALRNQYAADLSFLLLNSMSDACGIAWLLEYDEDDLKKNNDDNESFAFSVLEARCINDDEYAFTHELGHLFGANHDKYAERNGELKYLGGANYGYSYLGSPSSDPETGWRTVMAYVNECADSGVTTCPVRNFFSSPDFEENGISTGEADSNNRKQLIDAAPRVACFRDRPKLSVQKLNKANGQPTLAGLVQSSSGNITPAIDCGLLCEGAAAASTSVTLTASDSGDWRFVRWGDTGACAGSQNPTCTVLMSADQVANALFAAPPAQPRGLLPAAHWCWDIYDGDSVAHCLVTYEEQTEVVEFSGQLDRDFWLAGISATGQIDRRFGRAGFAVSGQLFANGENSYGGGFNTSLQTFDEVHIRSDSLPDGTPVVIRASFDMDMEFVLQVVGEATSAKGGVAGRFYVSTNGGSWLDGDIVAHSGQLLYNNTPGEYSSSQGGEFTFVSAVGNSFVAYIAMKSVIDLVAYKGEADYSVNVSTIGPDLIEVNGLDIYFESSAGLEY